MFRQLIQNKQYLPDYAKRFRAAMVDFLDYVYFMHKQRFVQWQRTVNNRGTVATVALARKMFAEINFQRPNFIVKRFVWPDNTEHVLLTKEPIENAAVTRAEVAELDGDIKWCERVGGIGIVGPDNTLKSYVKGQSDDTKEKLRQYNIAVKFQALVATWTLRRVQYGLLHALQRWQEQPSIRVNDGNEMTCITYYMGTPLGQGAFSKVVYVRRKHEGRWTKPAVARITDARKDQRKLSVEVGIMHDVGLHPNILQQYNAFACGHDLWQIVEFADCGALDGYNYNPEAPGNPMRLVDNALACVYQICQGLKYLHDHRVVHRDIKAGNVLVCSDGTLKIADFGVSGRFVPRGFEGPDGKIETTIPFVGTPAWMSPEVMEQNGAITREYYKTDIFSLGRTFLNLLIGRTGVFNMKPMDVLKETLQNDSVANAKKYIGAVGRRLCKRCEKLLDYTLQRNPENRLYAHEIIEKMELWTYHPRFRFDGEKSRRLVRDFAISTNVGLVSPHKKHIDRTNPYPEWDFDDM